MGLQPPDRLALLGSRPEKISFVTREGFVQQEQSFWGKTNLSEWANSAQTTQKWLERPGGQTKNPICARIEILRVEFRFGRRCGRESLRRAVEPKLTARSFAHRQLMPGRNQPTLGLVSRSGLIPIATTRIRQSNGPHIQRRKKAGTITLTQDQAARCGSVDSSWRPFTKHDGFI